MTDSPDASAGFIAVRMISRHFVVGDHFVVPVNNVETAIRPEMDGDRTKPFVRTADEVWQLQQGMIGTVAKEFYSLNPLHHRIGHVKNISIRSGKTSAGVAEGQAGKPGAAHAETGEAWINRSVRFRKGCAARITCAHVEGHDWIAVVVRFLDEDFP
jgi:hypothetical protein